MAGKLVSLFSVAAIAACGIDGGQFATAGDALQREDVIEGLLAFVNNPATDIDTLDRYADIDARAARNIVAQRPYATLAALDAVPYVGPVTLEKLISFARSIGFIPKALPGTFDGVFLDARQAEEVVEIANLAGAEQLRGAGLDSRQIANVLGARPIASAWQLSTVPYIGTAAMTRLRDFVAIWTGQRLTGDGALYDGVAFGPTDREIGLEIVNNGSYEQLVVVGGFYQYGAKLTGAHRPYANLAVWSNLRGIGRGTVEQLLGYVRSGRWTRLSQPAPAPAVAPVAIALEDADPSAGAAAFRISGQPGYDVTWSAQVYDWQPSGRVVLPAGGVAIVEVSVPAGVWTEWDGLILKASYTVLAPQAFTLAAADIEGLVAEVEQGNLSLILSSAQQVCEQGVGEMIACTDYCVRHCTAEPREWLKNLLQEWVGRTFDSRAAAVKAAGAELENFVTGGFGYCVEAGLEHCAEADA